MLFCHTGARFAEIFKLEWSQIDLDGRTILLYRSKVDNETRLVMTDDAYEVFRRRAKNPLSTRYVPNRKLDGPRTDQSHSISKAIRRAGLKDVHRMSHAIASLLAC